MVGDWGSYFYQSPKVKILYIWSLNLLTTKQQELPFDPLILNAY